MGYFDTEIVLSQPRVDEDAEPLRHRRQARVVRESGAGTGDIDGAVAPFRSLVVHVDMPPAGVGTLWSAELRGGDWRIERAYDVPNRLNLGGLVLTSTEPTGELAE